MNKIIEYFTKNHLVSNLIMGLVVAGGIFSWYEIRKEELPDFAFDVVSIDTAYPGASPQEVEQAITLPIEHELADLENVERMESTSRRGSSSIRIELGRGTDNPELAVTEIQNRILAVRLPGEVENPPTVRHRKTSQKAIIDVAFYFKDKPLLKPDERRKLQKLMRDFENQLLRRNEISQSDRDAYLDEEIHIKPRIADLFRYRLTLREIREGINAHHTDIPLGIMETSSREQVRLDGRLEKPEDFLPVPLRSSFIGNSIKVKDIADVEHAFQDTTALVRVNGYEAVIFNVVKAAHTGILDGVDIVKEELADFLEARKDTGVKAVVLDDESYGVRNRLSIIAGNAIIGFALILLVLSIFLNPKAALWVSIGIPFSFFFTLIIANLLDYTVNNMTLAGVIIAMGMLVDDAIVVSENISRHRIEGKSTYEAAIVGAREVLSPILASILTTIAAFLPLLAFEGRLALLTTTIPPIVSLILTGSLIESIIILPGHLTFKFPRIAAFLEGIKAKFGLGPENQGNGEATWFMSIENWYAGFLARLLRWRILIFAFFIVFVAGGYFLFKTQLSFSLFPREQVSTAFIIAEAPVNYNRYDTLKLALPLEEYLLPKVGNEFVGIRTTVGYRRYRPSEEENVVSIRIELDEDKLTGEQTNKLVDEIRAKTNAAEGFVKTRLSTQSFGSDTGSALEILVQEDDNEKRDQLAEDLAAELRKDDDIGYVEVDKPASEFEYKLTPRRSLIDRLSVDSGEMQTTMRSALSGLLLYRFYEDNEEKDVRLRFDKEVRTDIKKLLSIPTSNRAGYQIPLGQLVKAERQESLSAIQRVNQRRVLKVNADIKQGKTVTALELAERLERGVFRDLRKKYPGASFVFDGEVKNTRESTSFFQTAVISVILIIFTILAIQFNSFFKPLIIMVAIIPAWTAIVYTFLLHGINIYGFFAVVGALGLTGIVVNGSILLLDRIERGYEKTNSKDELFRQIGQLSSLRLRAVFLTTVTTVAGLLPTAYGIAGYDSMLAEMMLAISWGLVFAMTVTLVLVPAITSLEFQFKNKHEA